MKPYHLQALLEGIYFTIAGIGLTVIYFHLSVQTIWYLGVLEFFSTLAIAIFWLHRTFHEEKSKGKITLE